MNDPLNKIDYRDADGDCSATDQEPLEKCRNFIPDDKLPGECKNHMFNGACLRPLLPLGASDA